MNRKLKGNNFFNFNLKIFIFLCIFLFIPAKIFAIENKIILKIDNNIITTFDILNEIQYLKLINEDIENFEKDKIYKIAKNSITRDLIRENDIKKKFKKVEIDDVFLEKFILDYFSKLNFSSIKNLENFLIKNNLKLEYIKKKITTQLLWNELILKKFSKNVKVDKKKIERQILENKLQAEYLISEIVFNVKSSDELENKFNEIKGEIESNGFSKAAIIHSISDSSINGGKVGWVKENSLSGQIKKVIKLIEIGDITKPISIPGGFIILLKENKRETFLEIDTNKEIEKIIKRITNEQLNQFSNIYYNKIKKNVNIYEF